MPNKKPTIKNKPAKKPTRARVNLLGQRYLLFIVLFAAAGAYALWRLLAAPAAPAIYLTPANKTLPANTTFSVQVRENSGTTGINAIQANLSYDSTLIDFVSLDSTGSAFSTEAQAVGGSGTIKIARGTCGGCQAATGDQLVTTITFKTKATTGTTNVSFISGSALINATSNTDILVSLSNTYGGSYFVDTTAPTDTLTSPASGAKISSIGTTVISSTVSDNDKVASVDIYIDGVKKATLTTVPYDYSWTVTGTALGSHTIQTKATDPSGNVGTSALNTVTVEDLTPPTVSLSSPAASSFLNGTVSVNSTASDNGGSGVSKVEFYVDGNLKATDTTAPYNFSWDTTGETNASHSLTAKAYDSATPVNMATSQAVNVTVDNSAPSSPANFNSTSATASTISLSWDASSDNNGITAYRISRNGALIATTSGSTLNYNDTGLAAGTNYTYTISALDAAGNVSATAMTSVATASGVLGDCNADSHVDVTDMSILLSHYNTNYSTCDFNNDNIVNILDLSILLSHYGT